MGQAGFFDVERRLEAISAKGDPLETIKKIVRWEDFRADIESVTEMKPEERKSNAGRKPNDAIASRKSSKCSSRSSSARTGPTEVASRVEPTRSVSRIVASSTDSATNNPQRRLL